MKTSLFILFGIGLITSGGIACRETPQGFIADIEVNEGPGKEIPLLYRPKDGRSLPYPYKPYLGWTGVKKAARFIVQVSDSPQFETLEFSASVEWRAVLTPALPPNNYYWRVRAIDEEGKESGWSDVKLFTVLPEGSKSK